MSERLQPVNQIVPITPRLLLALRLVEIAQRRAERLARKSQRAAAQTDQHRIEPAEATA